MCIYNQQRKSVVRCGSGVVCCWVKESVFEVENIMDAFRHRVLIASTLEHNVRKILGTDHRIQVEMNIDSGSNYGRYLVMYALPLRVVESLKKYGLVETEIQSLFDDSVDQWFM